MCSPCPSWKAPLSAHDIRGGPATPERRSGYGHHMTTIQIAGVTGPRIGLGTNRLTDSSGNVAFLREAVEVGLRHIDTAHGYTGGDSERTIGAAFGGGAASSDDLLIATKGGYGGGGQGRPEVLRA